MSGSDLCVPEMNLPGLIISKTNLMFCLPFPHTCICERYIYSKDRSTYFVADRSWENINRSEIHECRNWERGCSVSFLGIHKSDFRYSVERSFQALKNWKNEMFRCILVLVVRSVLRHILYPANGLLNLSLNRRRFPPGLEPLAKFIFVPDLGDKLTPALGLSYRAGHIGWQACTTTLCRGQLYHPFRD